MAAESTPLRKRTRARKIAIAAIPVTVIVLLAGLLPLLPSALQVEEFSVEENKIVDLTTDPRLTSDFEWELSARGGAQLDRVKEEGGEEVIALEALGDGSSNVTLTYIGEKATEFFKITPNLILRVKMKHLGQLDEGDSFIALSTIIVWQNKTLIPLRIAIGNFKQDFELVNERGITLIRKLGETKIWQDYVLQMRKIVDPSIKYLRDYTKARVFPSQDFRAFGISASLVNMKVELDSIAYSVMLPAEFDMKIRSYSLIPMSGMLSAVAVNGTSVDYQLSEASSLPFATFTVKGSINRPLIPGEVHTITMSFSTGQVITHAIRVDKGPVWL